jgi:hypothetical protein
MTALTPITGSDVFARIVPVPSPELEKLPPASPLPISAEDNRTNELADGEESQASEVTRYTPRDPPSVAEDDATADQVQVDAESAEAEPTASLPEQPQPVGSYVDLSI